MALRLTNLGRAPFGGAANRETHRSMRSYPRWRSSMPNASTLSLIASVATLLMSVVPGTAQAGPQSIFKTATEPSGIEMAAQRCFWRGGQRQCASDSFRRHREYGFPQDYRTGSSRWWEEMDREGMGGRR